METAQILIGLVGLFNALFVIRIDRKLEKLDEEDKQRVTKKDCQEKRDRCYPQFCAKVAELKKADDELWEALNTHSHSTLPVTAEVTRHR